MEYTHRIMIPRDGELVPIESLSEEERKIIGRNVTQRLADKLAEGLGYQRVNREGQTEKVG